jgi:hypothetical protein
MRALRAATDTFQVVEEGIDLLAADGRYKAAHFMLIHGVRFPVIVRALAPGGRRRSAGLRTPSSARSSDHGSL